MIKRILVNLPVSSAHSVFQDYLLFTFDSIIIIVSNHYTINWEVDVTHEENECLTN